MIDALRLDNFRSYTQAEFTFSPHITVIVGKNGVGKTNILEAVSMLSLTTSWKTEKDSEVIHWQTPFTRIVAGDMELVVQQSPYMKRMRIDGVSKRTYQVIGHFPTTLFQPDDMQLLYGSPTYRRQYLDRLISQTSPLYTRSILALGQILKQRNRLLKDIQERTATEEQLTFWDQQLADQQEIIQKERTRCLEFLEEKIPALFAAMVPETPPITLHYIQSPHDHSHSFLEHLWRNRTKEVAAGVTLYGPHREDVVVRWGEHPAEQSLSRGQARSLLVAFKIAELDFIATHNEKRPVLLLDDIFSELDAERRTKLFEVCKDTQVIMTTTELGVVREVLGDSVQVIELT